MERSTRNAASCLYFDSLSNLLLSFSIFGLFQIFFGNYSYKELNKSNIFICKKKLCTSQMQIENSIEKKFRQICRKM